ncbi:MAG TPA: hypothetical protein ENJ28_05825 [Gammaproteobacteria bacterium]|nr:hypothetical protein [Gammaproteobacteria bacterium]
MLNIIGVSKFTLDRCRKNKRFNAIESDRLYRIAAIYRLVLKLFNDDNNGAKVWFTRPAISQLETQAGAEKVRDLTGRLKHGVFT